MPREITLTVVPVGPQENVKSLLEQFELQTGIHVNMQWIEWGNYRRETVNFSLRKSHVDVSMVGMPVTSDLEGMNVLRPFLPHEITALGGASSFLPSRWQSGIRPGSPQVWAVPWCVDVRVLAYWRDMLDQAGIDETTAFTTHAQIEETVRKLSASGIANPWYIPAGFQLMHAASSWIWAEGGDIFSPDGRRVVFHEKSAVRGLNAFFSLAPFANPSISSRGAAPLFSERQIAMTIHPASILEFENDPRMGAVPLPGGSYLGGVDLVIWGHTKDELACLELVRFLTQPGLLLDPNPFNNYQSPRMVDLDNSANWHTKPSLALRQAILTGRTYPCVAMVGLVEERLSMTLDQILKDIYDNPQANREELITARLEPLARRINISLSQD